MAIKSPSPLNLRSKISKTHSFSKFKTINCLTNSDEVPITHQGPDNRLLLDPFRPSQLETTTLGRHIARRLKEIGVSDVFTVPGDSNLLLLDHIMDEPGMNLIGCCNELNAGYAADGYARGRGVGACVLTFTVGGLSAINAIAGAYSENVPVICIVGSPNTNYYGSNLNLHHAVDKLDFSEEFSCFKHVTCHQAVVNRLEDAEEKIDQAIIAALEHSKPVYISISCNLPTVSITKQNIPLFFSPKLSNPLSLEAAVEAAAGLLNKAVKPVLVAGPGIGTSKACDAFLGLAKACGYAIAYLPSSKGIIPENHPRLAGCYWGAVSSPACKDVVESADATLFVGPLFDDILSGGHTMSFVKETAIMVKETNVALGNGVGKFGGVMMRDFLEALTKKVKMNNGSYEDYVRRRRNMLDGGSNELQVVAPGFIKTRVLYEHIQKMLSDETIVVPDTGDSWFQCIKLALPHGCGFQIQIHYASLGWSIGATLGLAQAAPNKRVITCVGDGAFQVCV
ncbi:pyruvate decarboxylase 1-like [Impatiens glandulifera]|uniref:pyruvate decarboxylase 1-like n=1 Tax=Impatiens glandulifera TaxID=253017 RepID=UPI001FB0A01B|nr:pyruvate decarboxylase 1-like [Impatiens glandulifera]